MPDRRRHDTNGWNLRCGDSGVGCSSTSAMASRTGATWSRGQAALLQQACQENVAGFERTYRLTFYASLIALVLGAFLPGWPLRCVGVR